MVDDRLALGRDEMTIFIDSEGNPTQKYALTWTDIPMVKGGFGCVKLTVSILSGTALLIIQSLVKLSFNVHIHPCLK